ncbi:hypothetical protein N658DRAFT_501175 [Parathielavia hyrcaniae]|uniref:Secreted protein n=1 Tax=Parathielavia hyrcaniae TaxID=113614 RepID=A0AAN6SXN5_9PEZI|nr:hypothetical protein N658DRAFT_501175 [Parathielavia hyrcaniae]
MRLQLLFQVILSLFLIGHGPVQAACPPEGPNVEKLAAHVGARLGVLCGAGHSPGVDPEDGRFVVDQIVRPFVFQDLRA